MTQRQVAKALGVSRTWVQAIERRALNKLAAVVGAKPKHPKWMRGFGDGSNGPRGRYRCGRCGNAGHNARTCNT